MSSLSPGVCKPSCQALPHPGSHTPFSEGPGPGQEACWRLEGGGLSNPQLLKRAGGEVKIGNKNKIAPAALVVCVGNKASPGPAGRAQLRPLPDNKCPLHQPLAATRTSTSNPGPRAGIREPGSNPSCANHQPCDLGQEAEPPPCATEAHTHLLAPPPYHSRGAPRWACHTLSARSPSGTLPMRRLAHPKVGSWERRAPHESERPSLAPSSPQLTGQLRPQFPHLHNYRKPSFRSFPVGPFPGTRLVHTKVCMTDPGSFSQGTELQ